MSTFEKKNLGKWVWLITETMDDGTKNYIGTISGMERVVVLNTGSGESDLRSYVEEIYGTEKPMFCICTRADKNTTGGAKQFDEAYIPKEDFELLTPEQQSFFMKTFDLDHHHLGGVHVGVYHVGEPTPGSVQVICTREGQQLFYFDPCFTDEIPNEMVQDPLVIEGTVLKGVREGTRECRLMIPEGVTEIAPHAFEDDLYLSFIHFPSTLKKIGERAFYLCRNLREARLPEGLEELGTGAFGICGRCEITIPSTLKKIGDEAFDGNMGYRELNIPGTVEEIGTLAFSANHGLRKVTLAEGVKKIGRRAFNGVPELEDMNLPHSVVDIEPYAFDGTNAPVLADLNPEMKVIGRDAFAGCHGLRKVIINEGTEEIDDRAFAYCEHLEEVVLPKSLKKIGYRAFSGCTALKTIEIPEGVEVGDLAFYACKALGK